MLEWNVYIEGFNSREIEIYNIFKYGCGSLEERFKDIKKEVKSKEEFAEKIKRELMYRFWSKCEWEIILSDWPPAPEGRFKKEKIDVWDQINLNWSVFVDYVWDNI